MGGCQIKLSEPLLQYRPISDMKNTLLHEMIHAYLFLSEGDRDREGHGPNFLNKAHLINTAHKTDYHRPSCGYSITVYHSFHDEVDYYRTHIWRCESCGNLIKRSMNRVPSEKDCRWYRSDPNKRIKCEDAYCRYHKHERECGGSYTKIASPEKKHIINSSNGNDTSKKRARIESFFLPNTSSSVVDDVASKPSAQSTDAAAASASLQVVCCPICNVELGSLSTDAVVINEHIDACLMSSSSSIQVQAQVEVIEISDDNG